MNGIEHERVQEFEVPPKLQQVLQSRKVWAGILGLAITLTLWGLGEIDGPRAIEAIGWVLGIFIGSVALEDGMTRLFGTLAQAVAANAVTYDTTEDEATEDSSSLLPVAKPEDASG